SDEEKEDLKKAYLKAKGDMDTISEIFIGYSAEEEDRLCTILKEMIKNKEVPSYPKFKNETPAKKAARQKRHTQEVDEAEEMTESLATAMQERKFAREHSFNDMIARLEARTSLSPKNTILELCLSVNTKTIRAGMTKFVVAIEMGLIDCCERDFGTKSLYGVLGVEKTVTTKD
ncbi:hypothetical protein AVEN_251620-1, partial [Araneus ventricosus]